MFYFCFVWIKQLYTEYSIQYEWIRQQIDQEQIILNADTHKTENKRALKAKTQ